MYTLVKHLHLTAIAVSVSLFILRFYWLNRDAEKLQKKWVKVLPHIVDTLLLVSAVSLCVILQQYPFANSWLTDKLFGLICYIGFGLVALKLGKSMPVRWIGFIGALAMIVFLGKVAMLKQPFIFG